jgi:hypothetical protein
VLLSLLRACFTSCCAADNRSCSFRPLIFALCSSELVHLLCSSFVFCVSCVLHLLCLALSSLLHL